MHIQSSKDFLEEYGKDVSDEDVKKSKDNIKYWSEKLQRNKHGVVLCFNRTLNEIYDLFCKGQFVLGYYKAERSFKAEVPEHVEKIALKEQYEITETPREDFVKYLLDLKMTEALALTACL